MLNNCEVQRRKIKCFCCNMYTGHIGKNCPRYGDNICSSNSQLFNNTKENYVQCNTQEAYAEPKPHDTPVSRPVIVNTNEGTSSTSLPSRFSTSIYVQSLCIECCH